jgi:hypothetical protein
MSILKVDTIQNTAGADQFANLEASSGYQKLPGGLILQWGSQSVTPNSTPTVTLPIAFPTAFLQAYASSDAGTSVPARPGAGIISTSQIRLINPSGSDTQVVRWLAIGY